MADAATADGGSLTKEFNLKSLWHWSHWLMVGGIVCSAFAAVATSGASVGVVDVAWKAATGFWDMVVGGYFEIFDAVEGASSVVENTFSGDFYTGDVIPGGHDMGGHGAGASADMMGHCTTSDFNDVVNGWSPEEFAANKGMADRFADGNMAAHINSLCH